MVVRCFALWADRISEIFLTLPTILNSHSFNHNLGGISEILSSTRADDEFKRFLADIAVYCCPHSILFPLPIDHGFAAFIWASEVVNFELADATCD